MTKMIDEKVSRERLLDMATGDTVTFRVPDYRDIESARTTAYAVGKIAGCRYVVSSDSQKLTVTVTRKRLQP